MIQSIFDADGALALCRGSWQALADFGFIRLLASWILLILVHRVSYQVLFSPLRRIPGPFLSRLSSKHSVLKRMFAVGTKSVGRADYEAYGEIYVNKPNGVCISNPDDIRTILASQEFRKTDIYKTLDILGNPSIFTTTDPAMASKRRRQIGRFLNPGFLARMEPLILRYSILAIKSKWDGLIDQNGGMPVVVNYRNDTQYATFDTIGALAFGREFNTLADNDPTIIRWIEATGLYLGLTKNFPLLNYPPFSLLIRRQKAMFESFLQFAEESVEMRRRMLRSDVGEGSKPVDLLQAFIDAEDPEAAEKVKMSPHEVRTESIAMQLAGSESTSFVASWVMHLLTLHPQHLARVVGEVRRFPRDRVLGFETCRTQLPYLEACVYETLRYSPITSGFMPRVSRSGGVTIRGHYIPSGCEVAVNLHGVHANGTVWTDPDRFDPTRFLDGGGGGEDAKRNVFAFSYGHRNCIGRHLAWMEMLVIIANILKDYDVSLPPDSVHGPHNVDELGRPRIMPTRSALFTTPKYPERDCRLVVARCVA